MANDNEEFWQQCLGENGFVLSQLFPVPVVIVQGKAYVGGKSLSNKGGAIVDFLLKNKIGQNAILVEIKTPVSPLLRNTTYRQGVFAPSPEVSGAIAQVLDYRRQLIENAYGLRNQEEGLDFYAFEPTAVIVAGNAASQLTNETRRRSFELFRAQLRHIQLITYDELFGKVESLIEVLQGDAGGTFEEPGIDWVDRSLEESAPAQEEDDIPF